MATSTSQTATDAREYRRLRAWELKEQGWKQAAIAGALGVTAGAVSQWLKRGREGGGPAALRKRTPPGAQARLTAQQRQRIPELLARGAEAFGFEGAVWTCRRVATILQREFGVRYHRGHVAKLLRALNQSPQKPVVRATQRDEAAIERWQTERWPMLQKKRVIKGGPSSG